MTHNYYTFMSHAYKYINEDNHQHNDSFVTQQENTLEADGRDVLSINIFKHFLSYC